MAYYPLLRPPAYQASPPNAAPRSLALRHIASMEVGTLTDVIDRRFRDLATRALLRGRERRERLPLRTRSLGKTERRQCKACCEL